MRKVPRACCRIANVKDQRRPYLSPMWPGGGDGGVGCGVCGGGGLWGVCVGS